MTRTTIRKRLIAIVAIVAMLIPLFAIAQGDGGKRKKKQQTTQTQTPKKRAGQSAGNKPKPRSNSSGSTANRDPVIQNLLSNMVYVEGGSFMMGSDDSDAYPWEKPVHRETVGSFSIGKYEVTQREWKAVMGSNPSYCKGDELPVEQVSWDDCQEFIRKLNAMTGKNFRLPTEAEWEYVARGGNRSRGYKYSGSNDIDQVVWNKDNSGGKTHAVGIKASNELGLYDMSGNVCEWIADNWSNDYDRPRNSSGFVRRGGCWYDDTHNCCISCRFNTERTSRYKGLGLRLAL